MANFFAQPSSAAVRELFKKGRTAMRDRLAKIVGDGARVDGTPQQIVDTHTGRMLDRFTIHILRPLSVQSRAVLNVVAANVFVGEHKLSVDIDWSRYDTRWFANDWTSQQRLLGGAAVVFALLLLVVAAWFERYRIEQLGGQSLVGNYTELLDFSAVWNATTKAMKMTNASVE